MKGVKAAKAVIYHYDFSSRVRFAIIGRKLSLRNHNSRSRPSRLTRPGYVAVVLNQQGGDIGQPRRNLILAKFASANYFAKITSCLRCGRKPVDVPESVRVNFRLQ